MTPFTITILCFICVACGLVFGFIAGLDWHNHQERVQRWKDSRDVDPNARKR